jgi:uncharacterized membrane protein
MVEANPNARLEAFCDAVFAIALTLLIIDVRLPEMESITGAEELWRALRHVAPAALAFLLSFAVIFITWVNHHSRTASINTCEHCRQYHPRAARKPPAA